MCNINLTLLNERSSTLINTCINTCWAFKIPQGIREMFHGGGRQRASYTKKDINSSVIGCFSNIVSVCTTSWPGDEIGRAIAAWQRDPAGRRNECFRFISLVNISYANWWSIHLHVFIRSFETASGPFNDWGNLKTPFKLNASNLIVKPEGLIKCPQLYLY